MRRYLLLVPLLSACHRLPKQDPAVVVEAFRGTIFMQPIAGAPDAEQLARIAPFLSDSLRLALAAARAEHDREVVAAPGEKPVFTDGDLFSSLFEGPSSFYVMPSKRGEAVIVPVHFERRDSASSIEWVDTVYVLPHDTTWVVDDIHYGGNWEFAAHGTLRQRLLP